MGTIGNFSTAGGTRRQAAGDLKDRVRTAYTKSRSWLSQHPDLVIKAPYQDATFLDSAGETGQ